MEVTEGFVNKVANSSLLTLNLEKLKPAGEIVVYDIKDNLFQGLILREKEFREFIKEHDFTVYKGKNVAITCSADAIVPTWAYMLLASRMAPYAAEIIFGSAKELEELLYARAIEQLDVEQYRDERLVIKGCGDVHIPEIAYVMAVRRLTGVVKSIMYGEPCSTVPIYKRKD